MDEPEPPSSTDLNNSALRPVEPSSERQTLSPQDWVHVAGEASVISLKRRVINFLLWAYGFLLVATMGIFYLQGGGVFQLPESLLKWLGASTLGEVAGLLALSIKVLLGSPNTQKRNSAPRKPTKKTPKT